MNERHNGGGWHTNNHVVDQQKSRDQLIRELEALRQQVAALEKDDKPAARDLARIERMRVVGQLAAGVVHNLSNALTGVLGPAQLLRQGAQETNFYEELDSIVNSALRARDVVEQLRLCVREEHDDKLQIVRVNDVVQAAVKASKPKWKSEAENRGIAIDVSTDLGDICPVKATESGLHNILINLIFNAVDAMPNGGKIHLCTSMANDKVMVSVSDSGMGMDEETLARVFDPFFTTKGKAGTGLGLSTVSDLVAKWGGHIETVSHVGRGSTFTISLLSA